MKRLPFNACDYRCERCLETADCAVFQELQKRLEGREGHEGALTLEVIRESFRETEELIKQKAREFGIDIDELAGWSSTGETEEQREHVRKDPLFQRSEAFTLRAGRILRDIDPAVAAREAEYVEDIRWHHTVIPAKVYRALGWRTDQDSDIAFDGRNSAAVAAKSLTICIMALEHLATRADRAAEECTRLAGEAREIKEELKSRFRLGN